MFPCITHTHTLHSHIHTDSYMPIKNGREELLIHTLLDASDFLGANIKKIIFLKEKKNY